jgi:hypothetical protein
MGATLAAPAESAEGQPGSSDAGPSRIPASESPGRAQVVIGEMAWLLRDARGSMLVGGSVLGGITIGVSVEAALSPAVIRPGLAGLGAVAVLTVLIGCWFRAAALLLLSGRPVLGQLSAHRWRTGAPVDPRVRWVTVPPAGAGAAAWDWTSVNLLLGAVRIRCERVHLAQVWTLVTAAVFGVWTVLIFLSLSPEGPGVRVPPQCLSIPARWLMVDGNVGYIPLADL